MWEKEMAVAVRNKLWNLPYKIIQTPQKHMRNRLSKGRETKIAGANRWNPDLRRSSLMFAEQFSLGSLRN